MFELISLLERFVAKLINTEVEELREFEATHLINHETEVDKAA